MSENTVPVTGGDLYQLFRVALKDLPVVENIYNSTTRIHADTLATEGEDTFGRAFPAWQVMQQQQHDILYRTARSMAASKWALLAAIVEYAYVDGDNANALTDVGQELNDNLSDPNIHDPSTVVEVEGEPMASETDDDEKDG